jgi:tetratricopeptide (TPR) repeat protein
VLRSTGLFLGLIASSALFTAQAEPAPAPAGAPGVVVAPGSPPVRYDWQGNHKKAQAALNARDYKTAIQLFTEILNSGRLPKSWLAATLYLRGKAYRSSRQYELAITDYQAATQADARMDVAFFELGATFHATGKYGKAVDAFTQAISLKDNLWNYYNARCAAFAFLSKFKEATRDCEIAVKLKPGSSEILAFLGRLYEETGQKQRAIETYKLALSINPGQSDAKEGLAQLTK